jgi:hypothetical protein
MYSWQHRQGAARWKDQWDKPTPFEILEQYSDDPHTIVHFSDMGPGYEYGEDREDIGQGVGDTRPTGGFKFGINPLTDYGTPAGIYGYALVDRVIRQLKRHELTFAVDRDWAYVARLTGYVVEIDKSGQSQQVTPSDYAHQKDRLIEEYRREFDHHRHTIREYIEGLEPDADFQTPVSKLWYVTHRLSGRLSGRKAARWHEMLEFLGYHAFIDYGSGLIHDNEPYQGMALERYRVELIDVVPNPQEAKEQRKQREMARDIYHDILQDYDLKTTISAEQARTWFTNPYRTRSTQLEQVGRKIQDLSQEVNRHPKIKTILESLTGADVVSPFLKESGDLELIIRRGTLRGIRFDKDDAKWLHLIGMTLVECTFGSDRHQERAGIQPIEECTIRNCTFDIRFEDLEAYADEAIANTVDTDGFFGEFEDMSWDEVMDAFPKGLMLYLQGGTWKQTLSGVYEVFLNTVWGIRPDTSIENSNLNVIGAPESYDW